MVRRISQVLALSLALFGSANADFYSNCKFKFGVDWTQHVHKNCADYRPNCTSRAKVGIPTGVDFIASFIGWTQDGSVKVAPAPRDDKEGLMLADAAALGATPVWYSYIIADGMKVALNLDANNSDCNGSASKTICTEGGAYIRNNKALIISQYKAYAEFAAQNYTSGPMIWALEPDFYQYTSTQNRNNNPITNAEAVNLLESIVAAIKGALPNAEISMDISPWAPSSWFQALPYSKFKYMNTSGGVSQPGSAIQSANPMTWANAFSYSGGLSMIADDGYGAGGTLTSPNSGWSDVNNLKSRISEGVIALMEAYPGSGWATTIASLRTQLPDLKTCGGTSGKTTFALTLTAGNGGSITATPSALRYDSAATVQLTAVPQTGYQFVSWSGDVTGTSTTASIKVVKNSTVTATFQPIPASKFTLTVLPTTGGTIVLEPNQTSYDSAALVKVTAVPATGYTFTIWKDAVVTKVNPNQVLMNKNKSIGATFTSNTAVLPRKNALALKMVQSRDGISVRLPVESGILQAEVVGMDGSTETVLQSTTVQAGTFEANYSLDGVRPGLHVIRIVNGETEYRGVATKIVR